MAQIRWFLFIAALPLCLMSCRTLDDPLPENLDPKAEMRNLVIGISDTAKSIHPGFAIIPQNGIELVSTDGTAEGNPHTAYLAAIDGNGQEDLFYGYNRDDRPTPNAENAYLKGLLDISRLAGNTILVTDYCNTPAHMDDANAQNQNAGYISFAADNRELSTIPAYPHPIHRENNRSIQSLGEVHNFLYLINPEGFANRADFIAAVQATNYDLLLMDLFFHDGSSFTAAEVEQLREKANGGSRLVVAYMSIGEAEDYRYYWQAAWQSDPPSWLEKENPAWPGNYKVRYWDPEWQAIIYKGEEAYLRKILSAGFDGVYLDIIDGFEYFE